MSEPDYRRKTKPTERAIMQPLNKIRDVVCKVFGCTTRELMSTRGYRHICWARHAWVYLVREADPLMSFPRLSKPMQRDHTTLVNSNKQARTLMRRNKLFRAKVAEVRKRLGK